MISLTIVEEAAAGMSSSRTSFLNFKRKTSALVGGQPGISILCCALIIVRHVLVGMCIVFPYNYTLHVESSNTIPRICCVAA